MANTQTVWVVSGDPREDEDNVQAVYSTKRAACLYAVNHMARKNPEHRGKIRANLAALGPVATYNRWATAWLWCCDVWRKTIRD